MRCAPRVPYPQPAQSGPFSTLHAPPPPHALPARISPFLLSFFTRQSASAFNQPLSLDTSSVTNMFGMFQVRFTRALPSASTVGAFLHAVCAAAAALAPSRLSARTSFLLCFPFHSAERVGVQPVAELGHVQRHDHVSHVLGALYACPTLSLHSRRPSCTLHAPPRAAAPRPPASQPACHPPPMLPVLLRRAQAGCPTRTSSSSVVRGRATPRLTA